MEEYPGINVVGEEWSGSPVTVSYWQRGRNPADGYVSYLPSLFDFPLHEAVLQGLQEKEDWGTGMRRIYRVLAADALYPDPYNLVVFADNHDVNRMFTVLGERADLQRMAIALVLTTRGIPQVFYGTEILMTSPGPKNDGVIRSGFPGGWAGDRRNAFTGEGLTDAQRSMQDYTRTLLQWRRTAPAIRDGKLTHFVPFEGIYVYFRHNDAQKLMVILNNSDEARTVETQRFREVLGDATRGVDVVTKQSHDVTRRIDVPARSATILELN
jgi:glycosidase